MLVPRIRASPIKWLAMAAMGATASLLLIGCAWLLWDLPPTSRWTSGSVAPSTIIYDRRGHVLYEIVDPHAGLHRPLPLEGIPLQLRQATLATEDASFYANPGVDPRAIVRALWINVRGGEVLSGGSTITQQLARNLLLSPEERGQRTLSRKLRESILAFRLARSLSKDRILELYLNQTYYGNMAYGVAAAADIYFGKPAGDLDLAECALLAGLPQAPAIYDPLTDPGRARDRQLVVLALMTKSGYISDAEATAAGAEELGFAASPFAIRAPHFVTYVWEILRHEYGEEALYRQGLQVHTSLDVELQERIQGLVQLHLRQLNTVGEDEPMHNVTGAAVVVMDPQTGDIRCMLGSPDYFDPVSDGAVNVALMPRQPGSAIKPLTYAAAFARDYTASTMLLDVPTTFLTREGRAYSPVNYDGAYHGPVLLRQALGSSLNVVAVKVLEHVGIPELVSLAQKMGLSSLRDPHRYGLALTLGGGEVRLLNLTAAYATFANGGFTVPPRAILRVERSDGQALPLPETPASTQVLDEQVAFLITDILADDSARIPAFGEGSALALTRPASVKTGTTSDWRDNWTVGYTLDLVAGVWVGNADNSPMVDVSGIDGAAPIWKHLMEEAMKGIPVRHTEPPEGMERIEVCTGSGLLPNPHCMRRRLEWFVADRAPLRTCEMHSMVDLDVRTGQPALSDTPAQYVKRRQVTFLPPEAAEWAFEQIPAGQTVLIADSSHSPASTAVNGASISLTAPEDHSTYNMVPDLPADSQRITVAAACGLPAAVTAVRFYVDGALVAVARQPPFQTLWQLEPGEHSFYAEALLHSGDSHRSPVTRIMVVSPPS